VRSLILQALVLASCSSDLSLPEAGGDPVPPGSIEPPGLLARAPSVFRLRVAGGARRSAVFDYRLFEGELGAYHLGRIRERELPATLLERELPVFSWLEERDVLVAPLSPLASGKYSFASPEIGLVAEVVVDASLAPVLERAWPPPEVTTGGGSMIFCGDAAGIVVPGPVSFAPSGIGGIVTAGLDANGAFASDCIRVEPRQGVVAGTPLLPPPFVGDVALAPRALVVVEEKIEPPVCAAAEVTVGPICASVADDRVELRSPGAPAFVAFTLPRPMFGAVRPGASLVLRGFEPASRARIVGLAFDWRGDPVPIDLEFETALRRPHIVLNEVFSNPVGAETAGEWLELVNDGTQAVELGGFVLDDAVEPVTLPAHRLEPGAFALLVAETYAPDPELELVPEPDVVLLRVPRLGRSGLANAGELLRLREPGGAVVSRFPPLAAPGPGTSVARRTPDAPDADSVSFGAHASPGASPGRPNALEAE